jgi:hypothetical protein
MLLVVFLRWLHYPVTQNSKFTFRGVDLDQLLDMKSDELVTLFHARARRR